MRAELREALRKIAIAIHIMTAKCEIGTQSIGPAFHKILTR
jgi:hypothetical protein